MSRHSFVEKAAEAWDHGGDITAPRPEACAEWWLQQLIAHLEELRAEDRPHSYAYQAKGHVIRLLREELRS